MAGGTTTINGGSDVDTVTVTGQDGDSNDNAAWTPNMVDGGDLEIAGGVAAYTGLPSDTPLATTTVQLVTPQAGPGLSGLQASFDEFTAATGIVVTARANRGDEVAADQIHGILFARVDHQRNTTDCF